jgi:hypothetical protein
MPGRNCAFYCCPTSQKHKLSLFQIPAVVSAKQSEYTASIKTKSREEWLKIILRTREMTPELKSGSTTTIYMFVNAILKLSYCIQSGRILICITMHRHAVVRRAYVICYAILLFASYRAGLTFRVARGILSARGPLTPPPPTFQRHFRHWNQ